MRSAILLHLYYPDIAPELIDRVAGSVPADIDVVVTTPAPLPTEVATALQRLPNAVAVHITANRGWDIGPLFEILPYLAACGYDLLCKLHTKRGVSGQAAQWRDLFYRSLIGSADQIARVTDAFATNEDLVLAGPELLYKSAAAHRFGNADALTQLLPALSAPRLPPADWGFFAGTMFWVRRDLIERLAPLALFDTADEDVRDGSRAHALERLFGLIPAIDRHSIGLIAPDRAGDGTLTVVAAPGTPSHDPVMQTLVSQADAAAGIVDAALARHIADSNPLVHYILHGRDDDALDPNPYFSSTWYNRINADVFEAGVHPLTHYLHDGAHEDRSTGPLFDMGYYVANNPDVRRDGWDPLRHYLEIGLPAGQRAVPGGPPAPDDTADPLRFYPTFDLDRERRLLDGLATLPEGERARASNRRVSVVMPVHDRADRVGRAIASVLAQTHANLELLVVDDGSTDGSVAAIKPYLADERVRLIRAAHGGVSHARNLGLAAASGDYIAYLDADNSWKPWFLEGMQLFMASSGHDVAYSAIEVRDDLDQLTGYRGAPFDWAACLEQNYVDLNAFCHARALFDTLGGFDPTLRRMVDWDLILRYGRDHPVGYAAFVGCEYFDGTGDGSRITLREPTAFAKVVRARHEGVADAAPLSERVRLTFAIKIAAPQAERAVWGDYHFADSLRTAIERLGHRVHIDFRGHWYARPVGHEDVAIVLRGLIPYEPKAGQIVLHWTISHPDQVEPAEYDRASRAYVASRSWAELLRFVTRVPVDPLLQATDDTRFHPLDEPPAAPDILFCGNSRGVDRDIVDWGVASDRLPVIYGDGWDGRVPDGVVAARSIDNDRLGPLYAGAGIVLNDHWPSMRAFGIVSNRLFDIVASGGRAVSDAMPAITALFGDAVTQVSDATGYAVAVDRLLATPRDAGRESAAARDVIARHAFDVRACRLVADAYDVIGLADPDAVADAVAPRVDDRLRVHLVVPYGPFGPQSSAYIRLLLPLTDPSVNHRLSVTMGGMDDPLAPCDVCIVQRTALPSLDAADALIRAAGRMGAVLVTDVDDAFALIGADHPERERYAPLNAALERIMAASAETWFSTRETRAAFPRAVVAPIVPNALDPRLWRDFRRPAPPVLAGNPVRMLYMGTATHGADLALIRPALDRLAAERPGRFDVTIVGVTPDVATAPWLHRLSPPADAIAYPRFVRWLRAQGPFDIGLAPLTDTPFNAAKSDIKLLDYAALGLLPVVSDGPAYRADRTAADLAIRVGADDWFDALTAIIDDPASHADRAAALGAHLWAKRGVAAQAAVLADRIAALVGVRGGPAHAGGA